MIKPSPLRINHHPIDSVQLYRKQDLPDNEGVVYHPLSWDDFAQRIERAETLQDFQAIYPLLIRTSTFPQFRYYPVPRLLNHSRVPYYAEDSYKRLQDALEDYRTPVHTSPFAKVAMTIKRRLLRWPSLFNSNSNME